MPKLTQLPDGNWIDLTKVTMVFAFDVVYSSGRPSVSVRLGDGHGFTLSEHHTMAEAVAARDAFAAKVNEACENAHGSWRENPPLL